MEITNAPEKALIILKRAIQEFKREKGELAFKDQPAYKGKKVTDLEPLPPHMKMRVTKAGVPYFIDDNAKTTSSVDPRTGHDYSRDIARSVSVQEYESMPSYKPTQEKVKAKDEEATKEGGEDENLGNDYGSPNLKSPPAEMKTKASISQKQNDIPDYMYNNDKKSVLENRDYMYNNNNNKDGPQKMNSTYLNLKKDEDTNNDKNYQKNGAFSEQNKSREISEYPHDLKQSPLPPRSVMLKMNQHVKSSSRNEKFEQVDWNAWYSESEINNDATCFQLARNLLEDSKLPEKSCDVKKYLKDQTTSWANIQNLWSMFEDWVKKQFLLGTITEEEHLQIFLEGNLEGGKINRTVARGPTVGAMGGTWEDCSKNVTDMVSSTKIPGLKIKVKPAPWEEIKGKYNATIGTVPNRSRLKVEPKQKTALTFQGADWTPRSSSKINIPYVKSPDKPKGLGNGTQRCGIEHRHKIWDGQGEREKKNEDIRVNKASLKNLERHLQRESEAISNSPFKGTLNAACRSRSARSQRKFTI
eukprot:UC4_evm7s506